MKSKRSVGRALEQRIDAGTAVEPDAARVVDAGAVERFAGGEDARPDPSARLDRLALLLPFEGVGRRVADRGHAEGQEDAALRFAQRLGQVGVALDQAGHDGPGRRVDDGAAVQIVAMRRHLGDPGAVDHDVHPGADVATRGRRTAARREPSSCRWCGAASTTTPA